MTTTKRKPRRPRLFVKAKHLVPIMDPTAGTNVVIAAVAWHDKPWLVTVLGADGRMTTEFHAESLVQAKRIARKLIDGRTPREGKLGGGL